jgi:hypothetical protein
VEGLWLQREAAPFEALGRLREGRDGRHVHWRVRAVLGQLEN